MIEIGIADFPEEPTSIEIFAAASVSEQIGIRLAERLPSQVLAHDPEFQIGEAGEQAGRGGQEQVDPLAGFQPTDEEEPYEVIGPLCDGVPACGRGAPAG